MQRAPQRRTLMAERLEARTLLTAVITEFMADNDKTLADGDGKSSDWIEIANTAATPLDLIGWYLTDDPAVLDKWPFPARTLNGGEHLVVFASAQTVDDYVDAGGNLHTNFSLNAQGDYVALVQDNGGLQVVSEFRVGGGQYPNQLENVSYGIGNLTINTTLVDIDSSVHAFIPANDGLAGSWTGGQEPFDDSAAAGWLQGQFGVGFDTDAPGPVTPTPVLGWNAAFPASGSVWEPATGSSRSWSFSTPPDWIDAAGFWPGITHAYHYDGNADVTSASYQGIGDTGPASFEMWFKPADLSGGDQVLWETGGVNGASLTLNDNILRFGTSNTGESPTSRSITYALSGLEVATFVQVVGVIDMAAGETRLYVNGALQPGTVASATADWSGVNNAGLGVEGSNATGGFASGSERGHGKFKGDIAIFNFYDMAVTDSQVQDLYSAVTAADYSSVIGLNLETPMHDVNASAYLRTSFDVIDPAQFDTLRLNVQYDDGFVAYLNGQELARRNAPASLTFDANALADRGDQQALIFEQMDASVNLSALQAGTNVLAFQALNVTADDADFLLRPELTASRTTVDVPLYFTEPTPGTANGSGYLDYVRDTKFSVDRGFFETAFDVSISTATAGAAIYYTTDGSVPTPDTGTLYTAPIPISTTTVLRAAAYKDGYIATAADTQTYLFLSDVIHQPNDPAGYPATWAGRPADYEMDPDVVGPANLFDDLYRDTIIDDLKSLPTVSLVTDIENLFGPSGIYENPQSTGSAWERPVSVEFFTADQAEEFHANSGLRVQGGSSRSPDYPKHSFRLEFRDEYGPGKLNYDLFGNQPFGDSAVEVFDEVVLRAAFNNSWTHWHYYQAARGQYTRDQWVRDLSAAMGQPTTHGRYAHLYINGMYWGIYNVGERPAAPYQAEYFGGDQSEWDVLNSGEAINGDTAAWNAMFAIANGGVGDAQSYANLQQYLDVDNFIDYMIMNFYVGNADWDGHNWIAARQRVPSGRFQFFAWDSEFAIGLPPSNRAVGIDGESQIINIDRTNLNGNNRPSRLFQQLLANEEFRVTFGDHVHRFFYNEGALTPSSAASLWNVRAAQVDRAVVAESARWGDYRRDVHPNIWPMANFDLYTRSEHFLDQQDFILNDYLPVRSGIVLSQFVSKNVYPEVVAPAFNQHGGFVAAGFELTITAPAGTIYYTLDGTDPREVGGAVAANALAYSSPITLNSSVTAKARVWDGTAWSALNEAEFVVSPAAAGNLAITEVHYNPPAPTSAELALDPNLNNDDFEFVELRNTGAVPIDLTGVHFADGISFNFNGGNATSLDPGAFLLIVSDQAAFEIRYGTGLPVAGEYAQQLSNGGERVLLLDAAGVTIHDFTYDDSGDWPLLADGFGSSLTVLDTLGIYADPFNWFASGEFGGTPGVDGSHVAVARRRLFYDGSAWDASPSGDDHAVALDKVPLLPGQRGDFENYSSFSAGLTGVMIDVHDLANAETLTASDFLFLRGNVDDLAMWSAVPDPDVLVRGGEGVGGSDRIVLTWPAGTITNDWLSITLRAAPTGLVSDDTFYFGSAVGESGDATQHALVNAFDRAGPRDNPTTSALVTNRFDYNRDKLVDGADIAVARDSPTSFLNSLKRVRPSAAASPVPQSLVLESTNHDELQANAGVMVEDSVPSGPVSPEKLGQLAVTVRERLASSARARSAAAVTRLDEQLLELLAIDHMP